jgi:uncharacterized protein YecE (DUF72 family)
MGFVAPVVSPARLFASPAADIMTWHRIQSGGGEPAMPPDDDNDAKTKIIIGTSGFQYADWVGNFYPPGTKSQDMLATYAEKFEAVELNFTYYGLPKAQNIQRMSDATRPDFEFVVKAHKTTTHEQKTDDVRPLLDGLRPLMDSGKLRGILCQFPWRFRNTVDNRRYLVALRKEFEDLPLFVEFRHDSWMKDPLFDFLAKNNLLYVSVDEPDIPGLVPRIGRSTGDVAYLRFHSRRKESWWSGGSKARYDYDYSDDELSEWLDALKDMAARARKLFIFFNNCSRGSAAKNAESMRGILEQAGLL